MNENYHVDQLSTNKKSTKIRYLLLGILIGIVVCGVIFLLLRQQGVLKVSSSPKEAQNNQTEEEKKNQNHQSEEPQGSSDESTKSLLLGFDSTKCITNKQNKYVLSHTNGDYGINITVDETQKGVTLGINRARLMAALGLDNGNTTSPSYTLENYTVTNFSQEVQDIYLGGFGQDSTGIMIFYLMKDGTVEYTPLKKAVQQNNFISYGTIVGVENIVKFYNASFSQGQTGNGMTVLAQKMDGTFYDLQDIIPKS